VSYLWPLNKRNFTGRTMKDILLGVNVDHIATLRQARGTNYPDPAHAASVAEHAGADGITIHLREDRRHIQDRDVYVMAKTIQTRMNLETAVTDEMIKIAHGFLMVYYLIRVLINSDLIALPYIAHRFG